MFDYLRTHQRACIWTALSICLAYSSYALYEVAGYENSFVHPSYFLHNLPYLVPTELSLRWHDVLNQFAIFNGIGEYRPRFLTYIILMLDHHFRFFLYDYTLFPPPLSLSWVLQLIAVPYYLYRLVINLARDRQAAVLALAVYLSSVGFLSGFSLDFMPGKALTHVIFIVVLYLGSALDRRGPAEKPMFAVSGGEKYALLAVLFLGTFLDEIPLFAFPLLALMFPNRFLPSQLTPRGVRSAIVNIGVLVLPLLAFLAITVFAVPAMTERLFGYRFDYIGTILNSLPESSIAARLQGPLGVFSLEMLILNFLALFGSAVVPLWIERVEFVFMDPQHIGGIDSAFIAIYAIIVTLLVAVLATVFLRCSNPRRRTWLARAGIATAAFVFFSAAVQGRHGGLAYGLYYGSMFAVFLALLFGLCFAAIRPEHWGPRLAFLALTVYVVVMQVHNLDVAQRGWAALHNAISADAMRGQVASDKALPVNRAVLEDLWTAWRHGQLEARLREAPIPEGALYLVVELRHIDRLRAREHETPK